MASTRFLYVLPVFALIFAFTTTSSSAQLSSNFYDYSCPAALPAIKRVIEAAIEREPRMGASLLRLHFHDCFVHGCDGSILLDSSDKFESEKLALPNLNSARGFEVVDEIKEEVDKCCGGPVVSCADILAIAARDSVVVLGGPSWDVPVGRRDSLTASKDEANANIPSPFLDLPGLIANFKSHGLDEKDLVALSGGHTLGFSQCAFFRNRIYNETNIDPVFAEHLKYICPREGGGTNLAPFDPTPVKFDKKYFTRLVHYKGLLHSDQELFNGGSTDEIVKLYHENMEAFSSSFAISMIKMGNIKPLTGYEGEIRKNCRVVNY